MPRLHLSCGSAAAQIECAGAKARFCLREYLVYENSFELTKEFSVRKGETCRACGFAVLAAVSPLFFCRLGAHVL